MIGQTLRQLIIEWLDKFPGDACDRDLTHNVKAGHVQSPRGSDNYVPWSLYVIWNKQNSRKAEEKSNATQDSQ